MGIAPFGTGVRLAATSYLAPWLGCSLLHGGASLRDHGGAVTEAGKRMVEQALQAGMPFFDGLPEPTLAALAEWEQGGEALGPHGGRVDER
jgi:hypothetical protein